MSAKHMLDESELEALIERALELHNSKFKSLINEVLDERQELVGHPTDTVAARAAVKADAEFVRAQRMLWNRAASRVGNWVLSALLLGAAALVGVGAKKMGVF